MGVSSEGFKANDVQCKDKFRSKATNRRAEIVKLAKSSTADAKSKVNDLEVFIIDLNKHSPEVCGPLQGRDAGIPRTAEQILTNETRDSH
jgi:hypothetical protein